MIEQTKRMSPERRSREFVEAGFRSLGVPSLEPYIKIVAELIAGAENDILECSADLCEKEAEACISDIVPGDEIGRREANARAGALLTAAADLRAWRHK